MRRGLLTFLLLVAATATRVAVGDQYHFKNVLVGERAAGLAGAYAAISDDPSGIFYNPAGLAFSMESYISVSANAFSTTQQRYKNVVAGQDYVLKSQGLIPVFFGFTQNVGKQKIGFAIIVPNSDLLDQDDLISDISHEDGELNQLRRRFFRQDITYMAGPAISRELFKNFSAGLSVLGAVRLDKAIDNQFLLYNPVPGGKYYFQNTYLTETGFGVVPKAGIQFMPLPKWAVGLTVSKPINVRGTWEAKLLRSAVGDDGKPGTVTGAFANDISHQEVSGTASLIPDPVSVTLGNAWFASKTLLISADLDYSSPAFQFSDHLMTHTLNWSLGSEYFVADSLPIRLGLFSNNANTAKVRSGATDQAPHVNMVGGALALTFLQTGSSFSLGVSYATGTGDAQIIAERTAIQSLLQSSFTGYLTGSYQL